MLYTRPLVTPLTRPLTGKVLKQFDPLSNDPYLLFDAETSMLGELENPTLDLDASDPATLEVITATRSGVATFTDQAGVIQEAEPNTVRVDHVQGEELTPTKYQHIGYTDFSSGWSTYLGSTALGDGYNGQASLVCSFTGSGQSYQNFTSVDGVTYTGSFWARAVSASGPYRLVHGNSASGSSTFITLTSEWQFFSIQFLGRSGGGSMYFGIGATAGDVVEIAMPQVEEGTTATDFVPNTTGSPKFIASATYGPRVPMMLIEPSVENIVTDSSLFVELDDATRVGGIDAPDGSTNAKRISNAQAVSGNFAKNQTVSIPTGVAADYVGSVYVRGTAGETVNVFMKRASGGTFVTSGGRIVLLTGDWQRVENLALTSDPTNSNLSIYFSSAGETADTIDVWGAQIEEGTVSTSYIPTSGSAVTRNADNLVIDGTAFSDFYNATEGTVYGEFSSKSTVDTALAEFRYLNSSNRIVTGYISPNSPWVGLLNTFNGSLDCALTAHSAPLDGTIMRGGFSYKQNNYKSSINGASELSDTSVSVPVNINEIRIGKQGVNNLNGHIKRLIYWPTHSSSL